MTNGENARTGRGRWSLAIWSFGIATVCGVAAYFIASNVTPTYLASASIDLSDIADIDRLLPTVIALHQQSDVSRPGVNVSQIGADLRIAASGSTAAEALDALKVTQRAVLLPALSDISAELDLLQAEVDLMSIIVAETRPQLRTNPELLPAYVSAQSVLQSTENDILRAEMALAMLSEEPAPLARREGDSPIALAIAAWAAALVGSAVILAIAQRALTRR